MRTPSATTDLGQGLVEFALVIPLFLVLLIGVFEFAFALNADLSINYASRDAALLAAEAGRGPGADCTILRKIEGDPTTGQSADVSAPADRRRILTVEVYWSDQNGVPIPVGSPSRNIWTRAGSTACAYPGNLAYTVPYTLTTNAYPELSRCNVLGGCAATGGHAGMDTIGVRITYDYRWQTPLQTLLGAAGPGLTLVQSNATRMEPVL
jgi:hypothetical protein